MGWSDYRCCPHCKSERLESETKYFGFPYEPDEGEVICKDCGNVGKWQSGNGVDWEIEEENND